MCNILYIVYIVSFTACIVQDTNFVILALLKSAPVWQCLRPWIPRATASGPAVAPKAGSSNRPGGVRWIVPRITVWGSLVFSVAPRAVRDRLRASPLLISQLLTHTSSPSSHTQLISQHSSHRNSSHTQLLSQRSSHTTHLSHTTHTILLTPLISYHSSHTGTTHLLHHSSHQIWPWLITQHSPHRHSSDTHHTTHLAQPLISHNTHLTQHSSHTTHLTPLLWHYLSHHHSSQHYSSLTTHLIPLISLQSPTQPSSHHHSSHTNLIISWKTQNFTCGVIRSFYFYGFFSGGSVNIKLVFSNNWDSNGGCYLFSMATENHPSVDDVQLLSATAPASDCPQPCEISGKQAMVKCRIPRCFPCTPPFHHSLSVSFTTRGVLAWAKDSKVTKLCRDLHVVDVAFGINMSKVKYRKPWMLNMGAIKSKIKHVNNEQTRCFWKREGLPLMALTQPMWALEKACTGASKVTPMVTTSPFNSRQLMSPHGT